MSTRPSVYLLGWPSRYGGGGGDEGGGFVGADGGGVPVSGVVRGCRGRVAVEYARDVLCKEDEHRERWRRVFAG